MAGAYDLAGNPLTGVNFSLIANTTSYLSMLIDCETDYILKGYPFADVVTSAKHISGSYIDIENNPLDLTPWNGTRQQFDLRFVVGNILVHRRELVLFDILFNG